MANVVTVGRDGIVTVVSDGATDFDMAAEVGDFKGFPNGIRLRSIWFIGSAGTDILKVRTRTDDGVFMVPELGDDETFSVAYPFKKFFPYIKAADCTFDTAVNSLITFYLA